MKSPFMFSRSLLAIAMIAASGCGTDDANVLNAVMGSVSLDGEPLANGNITFLPDPEGPVATGGPIRNGEFSILKEQGLPAGNYKVSITSTITKGPVPTDPDELMANPPDTISLVPKKYNTETTLKTVIEDTEENIVTFELSSK